MKILVVEDNPVTQEHYENALSYHHATFKIVGTEADALDVLRTEYFPSIIVDLQLSDDPKHKEGLNVLRYIDKLAEPNNVFIVSGSPRVSDAVQSMDIGIESSNISYVKFIEKGNLDYYEIIELVSSKLNIIQPFVYKNSTAINKIIEPEGRLFWDRNFANCIGLPHSVAQKAIQNFINQFEPLLKKLDGSSFKFEENGFYATFWSKKTGSAIEFTNIRNRIAKDSTILQTKKYQNNELHVFSKKIDRSEFVEFIND